MVQKIILVFKTHFDIGFTDLASRVIDDYGNKMLRQVIETCRATRNMGPLRYVWTMPSWPLWHSLHRCDPSLLPQLEALIREGQVVWHGLPFTSHTDFSTPEEYAQGFRYARLLSEQYEKPYPIAAKMTDVPGHGLMLPDLLHQAGIRFLHLGCNEFATPPEVPPLFFWKGPDGGRVLTMYSKGGYGTALLPPEGWPFPVWMALMHTHDNCGPHSAETIRSLVCKAEKACPGVEVVCGTMDDFCRELEKQDLSGVPEVDKDLADTWIHGISSYPAEVSQMRENRALARRLHQADCGRRLRGYAAPEEIDALWESYYENAALFTEHTWGADVKTWLGPDRVYDREDFEAVRAAAPYRFMEQSWEEQRSRVRTCGALLRKLESKIGFLPHAASPKGALAVSWNGDRSVVENHRYSMTFDGQTGHIAQIYDKLLSAPLLQSQNGRGVFSYQYDRFGLEDINEFLRSYGYHFTTWGIQDYGRENYPDCPHLTFAPQFTGYELREDAVLLRYRTGESGERFGDAGELLLTVRLPPEGETFTVELTLADKRATPFVESGSLIFPLAWDGEYRLYKPGAVIDPRTQIARCANHALLNVEHGILAVGEQACLAICPKDTPLLAIGAPGIYDYQKEFPRGREPQLWFDLFNNMWGTNFPQWIEGGFRFRFILWGCAKERAGETPAKMAALWGAEPSLPGIPEDLPLVHSEWAEGILYLTLRSFSQTEGRRWLRVPGAQMWQVDLFHRRVSEAARDMLAFTARPYGLHCFAVNLTGKGGPA